MGENMSYLAIFGHVMLKYEKRFDRASIAEETCKYYYTSDELIVHI